MAAGVGWRSAAAEDLLSTAQRAHIFGRAYDVAPDTWTGLCATFNAHLLATSYPNMTKEYADTEDGAPVTAAAVVVLLLKFIVRSPGHPTYFEAVGVDLEKERLVYMNVRDANAVDSLVERVCPHCDHWYMYWILVAHSIPMVWCMDETGYWEPVCPVSGDMTEDDYVDFLRMALRTCPDAADTEDPHVWSALVTVREKWAPKKGQTYSESHVLWVD